MYQLKITLKQHTPLIHFQHDQDGATLRASEVKPRLDRFLIETIGLTELDKSDKEGKKMKPKEEYKSWFINEGKQHLALDYKMRIVPNGNQKYTDLIEIKTEYSQGKKKVDFIRTKDGSLPTFFGNLMNPEDFNENTKYKKVSFYDTLTLFITIKNIELKENIDKNIDDFFLSHNFGTRQSKGFGSFTVEKPNYTISNTYYLLSDIRFDDFKKLYDTINYYHQRLKSGINYSYLKRNADEKDRFCHYKKAYLFTYIHEKELGYSWDKKWMKEEFFPLIKDKDDKKFVRALLGLSYDFKFTTKRNDCYPNGILPSQSIEVHLDKDEKNIQRVKSPITYKPIWTGNSWKIYILVQDKSLIDEYDKLKVHNFKFIERSNFKTLQIPNTPIDLKDLIKGYNEKELKMNYLSYNFIGQSTIVNIQKD